MYSRPISRAMTLITRLVGVTMAAALFGIATAAPSAAANFSLAHTGKADTFAILMTGEIIPGDTDRLKSVVALAKPGQKLVLMLESGGGAGLEGLQLGRFVHEKRMITVVPQGQTCASSCSFVFLAGRNAAGDPTRILMKDAQLGLHQGRISSTSPNEVITEAKSVERQSQIQSMVATISAYFRELSISQEFMTMMLSTPPQGMYYLRELDALRLGIYVVDGMGRLNAPMANKTQSASR